MSVPDANQHQSHSLTVCQNEDSKPKINSSHCSSPVTCENDDIQSSSTQSNVNRNSDSSSPRSQANGTESVVAICSKEHTDLDRINEFVNLDSVSNEVVVDHHEEMKSELKNESTDLKEITVQANSDEHVVQCEVAFKSQDEALASSIDQSFDDSSILVIDESRHTYPTQPNVEGQHSTFANISNVSNGLHSLSRSDQVKKLSKSNQDDPIRAPTSELHSTEERIESNASSTVLDQQASESLSELNKDRLLNSSTNNTTVNNSKTTNSNRPNSSTNCLATNKRKIDASQLHIVTACRKSARKHESQSHHSDNSIYLFESLRKRSSSISSTNSLAISNDLSR